jgi:hypothetical protein
MWYNAGMQAGSFALFILIRSVESQHIADREKAFFSSEPFRGYYSAQGKPAAVVRGMD